MSAKPVPSRPAPPPPISKRSSSDSKLLDEDSNQSKPVPVAPLRAKRGPNRPTVIRAKSEYVERDVKVGQMAPPTTSVTVKSKPAPLPPVNNDVGKSKQVGGRLRKLDIQVISARPMSEVGFRDAQTNAVPQSINIPTTEQKQNLELSLSSSHKIKNSPKLLKKAPPPPKPTAPKLTAPTTVKTNSPDARPIPTQQPAVEVTERDEQTSDQNVKDSEIRPQRSKPTIIRPVKQKSVDEVSLTPDNTVSLNEVPPAKSPPPPRSKPTIIRPKKSDVKTRQNIPPNQLPVASQTKHDPWNKIAKGEKMFQPLNESETINESPDSQKNLDLIQTDTQSTNIDVVEQKTTINLPPEEYHMNRDPEIKEHNNETIESNVTVSTTEVASTPVEMRAKKGLPVNTSLSNPTTPNSHRKSAPPPIAKRPVSSTLNNSFDKSKKPSPISPPAIARKPQIAVKPNRLSSRPSSTIEKQSSFSPTELEQYSPVVENKPTTDEKSSTLPLKKLQSCDTESSAPPIKKPPRVAVRSNVSEKLTNGGSNVAESNQGSNSTDTDVPKPISINVTLSEDNPFAHETKSSNLNEIEDECATNGISETANVVESPTTPPAAKQNSVPEKPSRSVTLRASSKPKPARPKTSPAITPTTPLSTATTPIDTPPAEMQHPPTLPVVQQPPPALPKTLPPVKKATPPSKPPPPLTPEAESLPPLPIQTSNLPEVPTLTPVHGSKTEIYEALFDYDSGEASDLVFKAGDLILITEKINGDWMRGEVEGRSGILPVSFVQFKYVLEKTNKQEVPLPSATTSYPFTVQTLYDYTGAEGDLSFNAGEIITVIETVGEWHKGTKAITGETGLFPASFCENLTSADKLLKPESLPNSTTTSLQNREPAHNVTPNSGILLATVLYDYEPASRDDLGLTSRQTITILQIIDDNWMLGEVDGKSGMFPSSFVEINKLNKETTDARSNVNTEQITLQQDVKTRCAVSLYDFTAEHDNDLSFAAGETITEIRDYDSEWLEGSIASRRGIFPRSFIQFTE